MVVIVPDVTKVPISVWTGPLHTVMSEEATFRDRGAIVSANGGVTQVVLGYAYDDDDDHHDDDLRDERQREGRSRWGRWLAEQGVSEGKGLALVRRVDVDVHL